jgi:uncharacterized protein YfaS (alpha-2-macroglobulin family)
MPFFTNALPMYYNIMRIFSAVALLTTLALCFSFCNPAKQKKTDMPQPVTNAPNKAGDDFYTKAWAEVDTLEAKGLFKTALERTETIATRAKTERNLQQHIKALTFRGRFTTMLEEDGLVKVMQQMEAEIVTAEQPEKALLQSMLGEIYNAYLNNQGWQLSNRTPAPDDATGDILTWSADQLERHIIDLYAASVAPGDALRTVPVEKLDLIVTKGVRDTTGSPLRPTLYDLLVYRALAHFSDTRSYLNEPAYAFELNQPEAFALPAAFAIGRFDSQDSSSSKWLAIRLYQRLTATHLSAAEPSPLIDLTLRRLQFARDNSTLSDKKDRYARALAALQEQYPNHPATAEILYARAQHLIETREEAEPKDPNALIQVAKWCQEAIDRFPGTLGASNCTNLLGMVRRPYMALQIESVNLPAEPSLVSLTYKNLRTIFVKVVRSHADAEENRGYETPDVRIQRFLKLPMVQQRTWNITDPGDYNEHRTEFSLDAMPIGHYILLVADNAGFDPAKGQVSYTGFQTSNLAIVQIGEPDQMTFAAAHRKTGAPVAGVKGDFYRYNWSDAKSQNVRIYLSSATTNADGFAMPKLNSEDRNWFQGRFQVGDDTLWINDFSVSRSYDSRPHRSVQFFTDRGLYRPGQTIYFKGIALDRDKNKIPKIAANTKIAVRFLDANGQEKANQTFTTNQYGTFNGTFTAPTGGLTGQMRIVAENGTATVQVEEYKRPKFEVKFLPQQGSYRLDDLVTAVGEAKNYAGSTVSGAQVRYRVVRRVRYPYWGWGGWSRKGYFPQSSNEKEIAQGTATTDEAGKFTIQFTALPDRTADLKNNPLFDYAISADVTDISGETRTASSNITVGKISLQVAIGLEDVMNADSLRNIKLKTTNLAGQPVAAKGTVTVQRLTEPAKPFKNRLWEAPDLPTLTETAFNAAFPAFAYKNEDDPATWARQTVGTARTFDTGTATNLDLSGLTPGMYVVVVETQDAFGEKVKTERPVRVWNTANRRAQFGKVESIIEKKSVQPGDNATVWIGTPGAPLRVCFVPEINERLAPRWGTVDGAQSFTIPVSESDRGGLYANWFGVQDNRFYNNSLGWSVPYSNKELNISYETFRDKLQPGQQEQWRLKISGPKKEKVAAEMVAALYDASLDQFYNFGWDFYGFPGKSPHGSIDAARFGVEQAQIVDMRENEYREPLNRQYPELNWFGFPMYGGRAGGVMMDMAVERTAMPMMAAPPGAPMAKLEQYSAKAKKSNREAEEESAGGVADSTNDNRSEPVDYSGRDPKPNKPAEPAPRRNLNETVFFFPELRTDAQGNVVVSFTMNEALTRWKFLAFAHTTDLQYAMSEKTVVTQKELMVLVNVPRFFRAGDAMTFAAKVSNLSEKPMNGQATLQLFDATSMQPIDAALGLTQKSVSFTMPAGQSAPLQWSLRIPDDFTGAVTWRIMANAGQYTDGEESSLPVVTNRMLVTETLPITVRGNQTKTFRFDNFKNGMASDGKSTMVTQRYTLEFTSNPAWYAVQSLPYLMEFPHECTEQIFSRFYANTLASSVTRKLPQIGKVYERWKGTDAMKSNLSKNQELKYALLEETPWVLDAQSEEQQKQNIALLFDLNRMADERNRALDVLVQRQTDGGGWSWFPGGRGDWYITQHIVAGLGHLDKLGALQAKEDNRIGTLTKGALGFCRKKLEEQYRDLEGHVKRNKMRFEDDHLDGMAIHYLYASSFFDTKNKDDIRDYYLGQAEKYWLGKGLYQEGMLALALHRHGRKAPAQQIINSLRERATQKEEMGMYWPFDWGMYWYQLPIETQALLIEAFHEVAADAKSVEEMRIWLLKNKQTNRWESTKATAEAVYALLLQGDNWLNNNQPVTVSLGGKTLKPAEYEAGTGYFKQSWGKSEAKPSWSEVKVANPNSNIVWGAAYWQYFEDLDKIKSFKNAGLTIVKSIYKQENGPTGPVLKPLNSGAGLQVGDKVVARIEVRADRPMEYVHLKDLRAAGLEPVNVLSSYKWQGGLGYYESTKDLATHFFFDYIPRGTFVLEYPMFVSHKGDFSTGIATLQCMYAPEFTTHSQGIRILVK